MGEVLALINARGGSKSIPHKNIASLGGKPMIAWTIEAAQASRSINRVVVSTDDREIALVAAGYGAEIPFLRPEELARDETPGIEPVLHAVQWLEEHERYHPEYVMLLQPTSPLRQPEDIEAVIEIARRRGAASVISVTGAESHPCWTKKITPDGRLEDFLPLERSFTRRQDLPPAYALNGAIYLVKRETLLEQRTFYSEATYAYIMPPERSLDIDTPWDFYLADLVLRDQLKEHG